MIKAFAEPIKSRIVANFEVRKIRRKDSKWVVSDGRREFIFDKLVSTIPILELVKALDDVPREIVEDTNNLKYNSLITVGIGINKPKIKTTSPGFTSQTKMFYLIESAFPRTTRPR